jgi:hypothetical protein
VPPSMHFLFIFISYLIFSHLAFNIFSFFSVLSVVTVIYYWNVWFCSCLFGVLETSYTWLGIYFLNFGKFSDIILLIIFPVPLACTSSPLLMPMLCRFGLFMELHIPFATLFCILVFPFIYVYIYIYCLWALKFCFPLVSVCWCGF